MSYSMRRTKHRIGKLLDFRVFVCAPERETQTRRGRQAAVRHNTHLRAAPEHHALEARAVVGQVTQRVVRHLKGKDSELGGWVGRFRGGLGGARVVDQSLGTTDWERGQ